VLRLVIETRKDQMERQRWRIRPRPSSSVSSAGEGFGKARTTAPDAGVAARIAEIEGFFAKPDGVTRWKTWLRALLEDMFVIDAPALYCQRTRSGKLCALAQLDGATIKRVIDDWGRTPQPYRDVTGAMVYPPAYQQVLKGLPAVNYSARDIIYRPRNARAHKIYGYSPVQQVLMTVNIALRRQIWQLDYYSEGSIPDALIGVPNSWTPDQIRQFQDYWDTEFSGDLARRRRAKFVPGDTASRVHQTKEPEQKNEFDEWLARIICFAFSIPPQWAVKAMNRATADNQSAQSEEEGLQPTKEWVKDLVDEILAAEFASPDLELHWLDEDDSDARSAEATLEARLKIGAVTLNEVRSHLGLEPYTNPAADRPMVLTATGYVPIEANAASGGKGGGTQLNDGASEDARRGSEHGDAQRAAVVQKYNPDQPRVPAGNPDGGQWTREPDTGSSGVASAPPIETTVQPHSNRGAQYAALETGTRADAGAGSAGVRYAAMLPPEIDPSAYTGISQIDDVTKRLAEILTDVIDEVDGAPPGKFGPFLKLPWIYGTVVHVRFAAAVITAGIRGISPLDVERPFMLPPGFPSGKKYVIVDAVLRNEIGDIIAIYDVKTGEKTVEPWRARELRAATHVGPEVKIIVLHPNKVTLKIR
jgi:hypothetical protein